MADGDLLDLNFGPPAESPAVAESVPPVAKPIAAPPVATDPVVAPIAAPAASATPVASPETEIGDDDWDAFQSAVPVTEPESAPVPTNLPEESGPACVLEPQAPSGAIPVISRGVDDFAGMDSAFGAGTSASDSALDSGSGLGGFDPFAGLQGQSPVLAGSTSAVDPPTVPASSFDPFASSLLETPAEPQEALQQPPQQTETPAELDPFSAVDLSLLAPTSQPKTEATGTMISLNTEDEFDPLAKKWATEQMSPPSAPTEPDSGSVQLTSAPAVAGPSAVPEEPALADESDFLGLGYKTEPVEEDDLKKLIYVYHKGEKNVVGWYTDIHKDDIKEAILCACDAIMDGGFVLREVILSGEGDEQSAEPKEDGHIYDFENFDELKHQQTYILESAQEREDLKGITGDRWRRLKIQIDPLLHVEAQKAIDRLRRGSNLLKHTHYGFPHLRQFQLSDDRKRLVWYTGAKRKEDSLIQLDDVQEIRLGQTTPVFLHYRLPMLEHLSFSLVYGTSSKTLDVTCKDEFEFDHWVTGLKALFYHIKNKQISKEQLLSHSKRFRKALEKSNVGVKLTKLPEVKEKGHVGLEDCIEIATHTPQQLDTKLERLRDRLRTTGQQVSRLDQHAAQEMEVDVSVLTGQGPAYASVFAQDEDAQDEEMEIRRIHELVEQTTQLLQQARNELSQLAQRPKSAVTDSPANLAKEKKKEAAAAKHVDQLLWKAEVDLENVEDMYLRHQENARETTMPFSMADMSTTITRGISEIDQSIQAKVEEISAWFSR